jgi:hypothetical protein
MTYHVMTHECAKELLELLLERKIVKTQSK